ncbi:MAG TPA: PP2C family protein-serine/threonine phosphatase [Phycisphaerales bacterium]|nr:PP2C family protein-serine/threonine phosphatase [Phycisphaerales bacterium]
MQSAPVTMAAGPSELQQEFDRETQQLLRRRFLWFSGTLIGLSIIALIVMTIGFFAFPAVAKAVQATNTPGVTVSINDTEWKNLAVTMTVSLIGLSVYVGCFWLAWKRRDLVGEQFLRLTYLLVVVDGFLQIGINYLPLGESLGIVGVFITHFLACCFLPWTPRQAMMPLIPVLLVWAVLHMTLSESSIAVRSFTLLMGPMVGAPGVLLCMIRHSRRYEMAERAFFYKRYRDVRRELVDARRIHEALFPRAITQGPVQLAYRYEPMQQIGGDFLFAHETQPGKLTVVVLDVTGHGILAALTVNRIWGELTRITAERPDIKPGELLCLLNRYAHLTLATHSVYLTALCLLIDTENDELIYASGGHPPAFIIRSSGEIEELFSTTFVLGACSGEDFEAGAAHVPFLPGDRLLAYTDGITETLGATGRLLGLDGLRAIMRDVSTRRGPLADAVLAATDAKRVGARADDTLVVELRRDSTYVSGEPAGSGAAAVVGAG